jgi:hypothetical protein
VVPEGRILSSKPHKGLSHLLLLLLGGRLNSNLFADMLVRKRYGSLKWFRYLPCSSASARFDDVKIPHHGTHSCDMARNEVRCKKLKRNKDPYKRTARSC